MQIKHQVNANSNKNTCVNVGNKEYEGKYCDLGPDEDIYDINEIHNQHK